MPYFNIIQRIEFKTIQDFLKTEHYLIRPKQNEDNQMVLKLYYEDAYKDLIEIGQIDKPIEFFCEENLGNKSIDEWLEDHLDLVIPSGIFKKS